MMNDYGVKDIKTEISTYDIPQLQIIFQNNKIYKIDFLTSMTHTVENNFNFKNSYKFETTFIPLELLRMLQDPNVNQIKEIKVIEEFRDINGENFIETYSMSLPIFSLTRSIDKTGFTSNWIIEITKKIE